MHNDELIHVGPWLLVLVSSNLNPCAVFHGVNDCLSSFLLAYFSLNSLLIHPEVPLVSTFHSTTLYLSEEVSGCLLPGP
jgi:hypothetical protein